jgi:glutamate dehydrogenase (NADP+)
MTREFGVVYEKMTEYNTDMRTAAYAVALQRIGEAIGAQGTVSFFSGEA